MIRTMAIAEAASAAGHTVEFSGEVASPVGRQLIEKTCSAVHPQAGAPEAVVRLAREIGADVVHIDTYAEQGGLSRELRRAGILLSSMEDGDFGRRPADLVIDPSPGAELRYRPSDGSHRHLRGAGAIPLRRSIVNLRRGEGFADVASGPKSVMILMGGTDARDMTSRCVELWARAGVGSHCIVVNPGVRHGFAVNLAGDQTLEVLEPSLEVPQRFPSMDLVISGAGTTTWELATLGVPMALVQLVDNQAENYAFATQAGMAFGLGNASSGDLDEEAAINGLRTILQEDGLRARLGEQGRKVVDGGGADRVVRLWEELVDRRSGVAVRPADLGDAAQLFDWRNEPSVRAVSREKEELSWDQHVSWVSRTVHSPEACLLIAEYDGAAAGTVRFQASDRNNWEVSITIAPSMRGKGKAAEILAAAESRFLASHPDAVLHAAMLRSNEASYKLFLSAGYDKGAGDDTWHRLVKGKPEFQA